MPNNNSNKIALIVLVVSVIAIFFNLSKISSNYRELSAVLNDTYDKESELEDLEEFEETSKYMFKAFGNTFNGASRGINSSDGFLLLEPNGDSKQFTIERESTSDKCGYDLLSQCLTDSNYGMRVCSNLRIETGSFNKNNKASIKVTTGSQTGYDIIKFTNNTKNEGVYVLVMVVQQ